MSATNAGPLTTIFTPPTSCLSIVTSATGSISVQNSSMFIGHFGGYDPATKCYPASTRPFQFVGLYYYSPGICPSGYWFACSWSGTTLPASVTASLCCPHGFECVNNGLNHVCAGGGYFDGLQHVFVISRDDQVMANTASLTTAILEPNSFVWADGVPVAWQSTDTAILSLLAKMTAEIPLQTAAPSPSPSPGPALSTGSAVGIAVAGTAALFIFGIFLFWLIRKRRRQQPAERGFDGSATQAAKELPAYTYPTELHGQGLAVELPGGVRYEGGGNMLYRG